VSRLPAGGVSVERRRGIDVDVLRGELGGYCFIWELLAGDPE
jgi:hypothetical protein